MHLSFRQVDIHMDLLLTLFRTTAFVDIRDVGVHRRVSMLAHESAYMEENLFVLVALRSGSGGVTCIQLLHLPLQVVVRYMLFVPPSF